MIQQLPPITWWYGDGLGSRLLKSLRYFNNMENKVKFRVFWLEWVRGRSQGQISFGNSMSWWLWYLGLEW